MSSFRYRLLVQLISIMILSQTFQILTRFTVKTLRYRLKCDVAVALASVGVLSLINESGDVFIVPFGGGRGAGGGGRGGRGRVTQSAASCQPCQRAPRPELCRSQCNGITLHINFAITYVFYRKVKLQFHNIYKIDKQIHINIVELMCGCLLLDLL